MTSQPPKPVDRGEKFKPAKPGTPKASKLLLKSPVEGAKPAEESLERETCHVTKTREVCNAREAEERSFEKKAAGDPVKKPKGEKKVEVFQKKFYSDFTSLSSVN